MFWDADLGLLDGFWVLRLGFVDFDKSEQGLVFGRDFLFVFL